MYQLSELQWDIRYVCCPAWYTYHILFCTAFWVAASGLVAVLPYGSLLPVLPVWDSDSLLLLLLLLLLLNFKLVFLFCYLFCILYYYHIGELNIHLYVADV